MRARARRYVSQSILSVVAREYLCLSGELGFFGSLLHVHIGIFFRYLSFRRRLREIFVALGELLPRVLRINCATSYTTNDSRNKIRE